MKCICINNKPLDDCYNEDLNHLKEGEGYEGYIDNYCIGPNGCIKPGFCIPSIDPYGAYDLRRFIPTSDIDETELVKKETVNA